jgi:hypothetical protein
LVTQFRLSERSVLDMWVWIQKMLEDRARVGSIALDCQTYAQISIHDNEPPGGKRCCDQSLLRIDQEHLGMFQIDALHVPPRNAKNALSARSASLLPPSMCRRHGLEHLPVQRPSLCRCKTQRLVLGANIDLAPPHATMV